MNWTELAAISETLSSIAVLITLIYLALQTKQSTQAIRATGQQTTAGLEMQLLMHQASESEIWTKMPETDSELTDSDKWKLSSFLAAFFRLRELDWFNYQTGVIDETAWNAYRNPIKNCMHYPSLRAWWVNGGYEVYDPAFVEHVNALIDAVPLAKTNPVLAIFDRPYSHSK